MVGSGMDPNQEQTAGGAEAAQSFDLREVVERALDRVARYAAEKDLELIGWLPESITSYVQGDPERVHQVLVRILNDTIVLLRDGGEILLEAKTQQDDGGVRVSFILRGTGVRVPEELDLKDGTGDPDDTDLDIPTSYLLVETLGGKLSIQRDGEDGVVTHLVWRTPRATVPRPPTEPIVLGESVLLVDDNATTRRVLSHYMTAWGLEVQAASSGSEALAWLPFHDYAVAVVDADMPGMDGFELIAALDRKVGIHRLPVVLLAVAGTDEAAEASAPVEPVAVLTKPIKAGDLRVALQVAIDQVRGNLPKTVKVPDRPELLNKALASTVSPAKKEKLPAKKMTAAPTRVQRPGLSGQVQRPELSGKVRRPELSGKVQRPEPSGKVQRPKKPSLLERLRGGPKKNLTSLRPDAAPAKPLKILLVEDNKVNQRVVGKMLQQLGYQADVVENGEQAFKAVQETSYDVVLMDVLMPVMDGIEATRRIRGRIPKHRQPRIIAMTAYGVPGDKERCLAAGMESYLSKPVRIEELRVALADAAK